MTGRKDNSSSKERPFLGIYFKCCHVYWRIYKNKAKTAYEGRCPKCMRRVSVKIGKEGTGDRFFVAQ